MHPTALTSLMSATAAAVGSAEVQTHTAWYQALEKPHQAVQGGTRAP